MSQEEDDLAPVEEESDPAATYFFSASTPAVSTKVNVAVPAAQPESEPASYFEPEMRSSAEMLKPQFDELIAGTSYAPFGRDFTQDFDSGLPALTALDGQHAQPATALFPEPDEESLRELDTPTFMRRLQF